MKTRKGLKAKKNSNKKMAGKKVSRTRITTAILAIFLLIVIAYFLTPQGSDKWSVSSDGILSYPENRGKVDVSVIKTESGGNYTLETISFQSKDYTVGGLLRIPSSNKRVPGVVLLPGATVSKEGTQGLAQILSGMGYASLGIDQRNRGGVDPRYDFTLFSDSKEPVEHMMVFDALRSVDVLRQDARIDPETYLKLIPPRKLVMMHSVNDSIIPLGLAQNTFGKAREPKMFFEIQTGNHGFSEGMKKPLEDELRLVFH